MNNTNSVSNIPSIVINHFEEESPSSKRPVEKGADQSSKRLKRDAERKQVKALATEIAVLTGHMKVPGMDPTLRSNTERLIYSKKLEELTILHTHLKQDAKKMYSQKAQAAAKASALEEELKKAQEAIDAKELENEELSYRSLQYIQETSQFKETVTKEKAEFQARIELLTKTLTDSNLRIESLLNDITAIHTEFDTAKAEMKRKHDRQLDAKKAEISKVKTEADKTKVKFEQYEKKLKDKITTLMQTNSELIRIDKQRELELQTMRDRCVELDQSKVEMEANMLVLTKQNERLAAFKQESDCKYQSLLGELATIIERRK